MPTPAKTATCTNLGTGAQYPCTQSEYDSEQANDGASQPTKADCAAKNERATYDMCRALGYTWGMTEREMRQHDAGANCATGTQLYWAEHTCYIVKEEGSTLTYNDGSVATY